MSFELAIHIRHTIIVLEVGKFLGKVMFYIQINFLCVPADFCI